LTTNVCKVQLALLELARQGRLAGEYTIVDIGVGAGTTALAVMDFLLTWTTVCNLYGVQMPVTKIQIIGCDGNQRCLDFAAKVCTAYAHAAESRWQSVKMDRSKASFHQQIVTWVADAEWRRQDLEYAIPTLPHTPVLLVASNVFNELTHKGKQNLERMLGNLNDQSMAIIIEPGDGCRTQALNGWRRQLLQANPHLISLGPCGQEFGANLPTACESCWNGRRESLHEPLLHRKLREATKKKLGKGRDLDEYTNDLLSWSYHLLGSQIGSDCGVKTVTPETIGVIHADTVTSRYIGRRQNRQLVEYEPNRSNENSTETIQYFKLCPGYRKNNLEFARIAGIILPRIAFGQTITLSAVDEKKPQEDVYQLLPRKETFSCKPLAASVTRYSHFLTDHTPSFCEAVDELAYRLFGFPAMRPFQHQILEQVLFGRSILGIAATGGGKSECYILPAFILPGITLVVSPLIALMQDQYEQRLSDRYGLGHLSTFVNGTISFSERQTRLKQLELGYYKLVYITPEQLERGYILDALKRADKQVGIRYLAFDEAHCISQWGHDFRPSYLNIVRRIRHRQIKPVRIALTATASPEVVTDICEELELTNKPISIGGDVYIDTSNRPELNLIVRVCRSTEEKVARIIDDLQELNRLNRNNRLPGSAIVFMPHTGGDVDNIRANTNENQYGKLTTGATQFAAYLERKLQTQVAIYHSKMDTDTDRSDNANPGQESRSENSSVDFGDLSGRTRREEQSTFINDDRQIMVATKGFGMGIDKPNIRRVIHRSPPANLEAYAQEAGRAGRDGEIADAILYYSPDRPETENYRAKSDYAIQDFFLTEKYIREIDVVVMYQFLKTVNRQVGGRLYFTNDEAIVFFDQYKSEEPFVWPQFPQRRNWGREVDDHPAILDRGHQYQQKTNYIDRILSVLYRIRPTFKGQKRMSLVESVQETGAQVKVNGLNLKFDADAILKSNTYFGELFREKGLNAKTLTTWLKSCVSNDVFDFAEFLDLSIAETSTLLWDIHYSDGNFKGKKWVPDLLCFDNIVAPKYGPAEGKNSLTEWRDYAGASSRAKNGRKKLSIDDWFGWRELPISKGWEVQLGSAFEADYDFKRYLTTFTDLHKRRETNDRNAFRLLLTNYIGVNEDGTQSRQRRGSCLRNVMLGYFKTGEVVLGGNCRSCSNCVPDGNYEQDIEKRRQLVQRLPEDFWLVAQEAEQKTNELPSSEFMQKFWSIVTAEADRQRSLLEYVAGWTAKLLQDTPEHKAAMWFRLTGMAKELLYSNEAEVVQYMDSLITQASIAEAQQMEPILNEFLRQFSNSTNLVELRAKLLQKLQRYGECASAWLKIVEMAKGNRIGGRELLFRAYSELGRFHAAGGPLNNQQRYRDYQRMAVRNAPDLTEATKLLQPLVPQWNWADLIDEIAAYQWKDWANRLGPRIVKWWIERHNSEHEMAQVIAYIADNKLYKSWDAAATAYIIAQIPQSQHRAYPDLTLWWLDQVAGAGDKISVDVITFVTDAMIMLQSGHALSVSVNKQLTVSIFKLFSDRQRTELRRQLQDAPSLYGSLRKTTIPFLSHLKPLERVRWLDWYGKDPATLDETYEHWKHLATESNDLATHYLKLLLQMQPQSANQIEDFMRAILNSGDPWGILSRVVDAPEVEPYAKVSERFDLMMAHVRLMAQLTQMPEIAHATKITKDDLYTIRHMCRSVKLPSRQNEQMFSSVLYCMWRLYPKWDTLPDWLLQSYDKAGLKEEALEVAKWRPTLRVGNRKIPALQYAEEIIPSQENLNLDLNLKKITESCMLRHWAIAKQRRDGR